MDLPIPRPRSAGKHPRRHPRGRHAVEAASQQLRRDGFQVLELDEADDGEPVPPPRLQDRHHLRHQPVGHHGRYGHQALGRALAGSSSRRPTPRCEDPERPEDRSRAAKTSPPPWPAIPSSSTRPTSRWSRPARPPARSGPCSNASPATSARKSRCGDKVRAAMAYPGRDDGRGHRRDDLPA